MKVYVNNMIVEQFGYIKLYLRDILASYFNPNGCNIIPCTMIDDLKRLAVRHIRPEMRYEDEHVGYTMTLNLNESHLGGLIPTTPPKEGNFDEASRKERIDKLQNEIAKCINFINRIRTEIVHDFKHKGNKKNTHYARNNEDLNEYSHLAKPKWVINHFNVSDKNHVTDVYGGVCKVLNIPHKTDIEIDVLFQHLNTSDNPRLTIQLLTLFYDHYMMARVIVQLENYIEKLKICIKNVSNNPNAMHDECSFNDTIKNALLNDEQKVNKGKYSEYYSIILLRDDALVKPVKDEPHELTYGIVIAKCVDDKKWCIFPLYQKNTKPIDFATIAESGKMMSNIYLPCV